AQKAKKISKKLDFKKGEANAYNIIGIMYAYKSNYPEAMKNFSAALKVWKEIGNKRGIADSYNHIGSIYEYQGNYPEALKNYFAGLKKYQKSWILKKERQTLTTSSGLCMLIKVTTPKP